MDQQQRHIDPQDIDINDYNYDLPDERIAKFPLPERDASRLLLYRGGTIGHTSFRDLPEALPEGALLVFNNTRVIHARLVFHRSTGARIEIFCLEPLAPVEHQQNLSSEEPVKWTCLIGNNKRWKDGELTLEVATPKGPVLLCAERLGPQGDAFTVRFRWEGPALAFGEILHYAGLIPLPPYLHRESTAADEDRYQTVYARQEGSVAAPTAGLHFTDRVLADLRSRGIDTAFVTLHVGAGTFRPVKAERLGDHDMHEEQFFVSRATLVTLLQALEENRPIIAVGTTSLRTLESLYWKSEIGSQKSEVGSRPDLGRGEVGSRKLQLPSLSDSSLQENNTDQTPIDTWIPYLASDGEDRRRSGSREQSAEALRTLLAELDRRGEDTLSAPTRLLIAPGYRFRLAHGLITNFHQPRSTLILLVAALVGDDWRRIYGYALANDFRFLSYGDSSLLLP